MSDTPADAPLTLAGEWWWYAAFFNAQFYRPDPKPGRAPSIPIARGYQFQVSTAELVPMGTITFVGSGDTTTITIHPSARRFDQYWSEIRGLLEAFAGGARDIRRLSVGITVDEVIAAYERAKAEGQPASLKDLAQYAGVSYAYVRKRKSEKDAKRKDGNKSGNID